MEAKEIVAAALQTYTERINSVPAPVVAELKRQLKPIHEKYSDQVTEIMESRKG